MKYPRNLHVLIDEDLARFLADEARRQERVISDVVRRHLREAARRRLKPETSDHEGMNVLQPPPDAA